MLFTLYWFLKPKPNQSQTPMHHWDLVSGTSWNAMSTCQDKNWSSAHRSTGKSSQALTCPSSTQGKHCSSITAEPRGNRLIPDSALGSHYQAFRVGIRKDTYMPSWHFFFSTGFCLTFSKPTWGLLSTADICGAPMVCQALFFLHHQPPSKPLDNTFHFLNSPATSSRKGTDDFFCAHLSWPFPSTYSLTNFLCGPIWSPALW